MVWLKGAIARIKASGAKKVLVQAPEGLKTQLQGIGSALEKAGIEAVLSCEPCYGACDLRDAEAKRLGCDLLLHIGHAQLGQTAAKPSLPVIYEEYPMEADPSKALNEGMDALGAYRRIGLVTTVQYIYLLDSAKKLLESKGKLVFIGKGPGRAKSNPLAGPESIAKGRAKHPGQVLGCDHGAAKAVEDRVDAFIFMGTGRFHALGLAAAVSKPVLFLDLESGSLTDMKADSDRQARIRFASIEKAKNCNAFGVIISTKPGQSVLKLAEDVKRKLESKGRNAWILAMDNISPDKLMGLKLDCLVNCACPRLSEDAAQFRKPIINPEEIDKL